MSSQKRIKVEQVVAGMYVQRLDGSWLDHPFWRRSFLIESASDLATLRNSAVTHLWIDVTRGVDVEEAPDGRVDDILTGDGVLTGDGTESVEAVAAADPAPDPVPNPGPDSALDSAADPAPDPAPENAPRSPGAGVRGHRAPRGASRMPTERDWDRARQIRAQARRVVGQLFDQARSGQVPDTSAAKPVIDEVIDSVSSQPGTLVSLSRLKNKDDYTFMHSVAVCALMTALGIELELDDTQIHEAATSGLLHDIGKMAVDHEVLNKPGKLTDAEFAQIKRHTTEGHRILVESGNVAPAVLDVARHHHERIDGNGYPDRLAGDAISLYARMGTVCDVYDAISSDRPYKKAWEPSVALQHMAKWVPGAYDPVIFQAFVRSLGVYPNGSLVNLASGRIAIVVEQNEGHLLQPLVRSFYSTRQSMPIAPELVDLSEHRCREKISGRVDPSQWGFGDLRHLWMPQ